MIFSTVSFIFSDKKTSNNFAINVDFCISYFFVVPNKGMSAFFYVQIVKRTLYFSRFWGCSTFFYILTFLPGSALNVGWRSSRPFDVMIHMTGTRAVTGGTAANPSVK